MVLACGSRNLHSDESSTFRTLLTARDDVDNHRFARLGWFMTRAFAFVKFSVFAFRLQYHCSSI